MVGGAEEDSGADSSGGSGQLDPPYSEAYWLQLWAFGTGRDGLGLSELQFWLLTYSEFVALKRVWEAARGIKPPPTKAQLEQYGKNQAAVLAAQVRVYNKQVEERRRKSGIKLVQSG
jgi:hypothetical protein